MDALAFDEFVERRTWRFAKTMAYICPHEYVVRVGVDPEFVNAIKFIREYGFVAIYEGKQGIYYIRGDFYYWDMGDPDLGRVHILNRGRLAEYQLRNFVWSWIGAALHE